MAVVRADGARVTEVTGGTASARAGALAVRCGPVALAAERALPVAAPLASLLPSGLRRGSVAVVEGAGATSLALALAAEASASGSWVAVAWPGLGLEAAAQAGVALERLLVVDPPPARWATVTAALVEGVDLILARPDPVRPADARRLAARLRERGAVLVVAATEVGGAWPLPPDLRLAVAAAGWEGVGRGHGRLGARRVEVVVSGRGAAARPRRAPLWLPGPDGHVGEVLDAPASEAGGVQAVAG